MEHSEIKVSKIMVEKRDREIPQEASLGAMFSFLHRLKPHSASWRLVSLQLT